SHIQRGLEGDGKALGKEEKTMKNKSPSVSKAELIEVLCAISVITKDLTRRLLQKGDNPYGTDEENEVCYRRPTCL
ncbi:MAG: hypothetical protein E6X18_08510, partial [Atopobium minutum]|nr:hypothetical protein [Atopobium minutum]